MNTMPQIVAVPFHDHQILTVKDGDTIRVVMKPIVELLGLNWSGQYLRIQRHPVLSKGVCVMQIPSAGGMQDAVTLELIAFHGWVVTLTTPKIADPDRRAMIERYQERSFQAIHDFWHRGEAVNPRCERRGDYRAIPAAIKLIESIKRETNPAARRMHYAFLRGLCDSWNIEPPALEDLGRDAPTPPTARTWAKVWSP